MRQLNSLIFVNIDLYVANMLLAFMLNLFNSTMFSDNEENSWVLSEFDLIEGITDVIGFSLYYLFI